MATTLKWATPNTVETLLSTGMNSLAQGSMATSAEVDNSSGLYPFADFELYISGADGLGAFISLYLVQSEDGTNFEDSTLYSSGNWYGALAQLIGSIQPDLAGFNRKVLRGIPIPPTKFKVAILNAGAGSFAASGNTVKMMRYGEQGV